MPAPEEQRVVTGLRSNDKALSIDERLGYQGTSHSIAAFTVFHEEEVGFVGTRQRFDRSRV